MIHKLYDEQFHVTTSFIILFDSLLGSKTKTPITTETALLDKRQTVRTILVLDWFSWLILCVYCDTDTNKWLWSAFGSGLIPDDLNILIILYVLFWSIV